MPRNGETPLSEEARDLDDHARGLTSDLTDHDVRRRFSDLSIWRVVVAAFLLIVAIVMGVTYATRSTDSEAVTNESAQTLADTSEPPGLTTHGSLSGTWNMFATGADGNERPAFTVQFVGEDRGTVEILEDTTEFDATFELKGDQVSFTFTRIFDLDTGDWAETSVFAGTLVGDNEILGEYVREDWACLPDRDSPCAYEPEPLRFPSRLDRTE